MIQVNLLPDVKLDYIKAERQRRLVLSVSALVTIVAVILLVLVLLFDFYQKHEISSNTSKISTQAAELKSKPGINNILTVQNQLESLTSLHEQKPAASRLFDAYLNEVTPATAAITSLQVDFNQHTMNINGTADTLITVNDYIDTLKDTRYTVAGSSASLPAFSDVVLSSFGLSTTVTDPSQAASYNITLSFDPAIFNIAKDVSLTVPSITTTRSEQTSPSDLFKVAPSTKSSTTTTGGQ